MPRWFPCVFTCAALSACAVPAATPAGSGAPNGAPIPGATSGAAAVVTAASPVPAPKRTPVVAEVPEGGAVVYADATGVWALDPGGPPRQLADATDAGRPQISPSREWVLYETRPPITDTFEAALWLVPLSGGEPRRVLAAADLRDRGDSAEEDRGRWLADVTWTPGSDVVVFNTDEYLGMGGLREGLWTVDAADTSMRQVLSLEQGGPFVLSPDGQWAAITHNGWEREPTAASVAVVRLSDLEVRLLSTFPAIVTDSGYSVELRPQFTPDGTSLLVASLAAEEDGTALAGGDTDVLLHRLPLDGEPEVIGTLPRNDFNSFCCEFPTWSPDGQRLAHVIGARSAPTPVPTDPLATAYPPPPEPGDYGDLVIADRDGSRQRVYATMPGLRFDGWARDGVHFRFEGDRRWWIGAEGEAPVDVPAPYLVAGGGAAWFVADRRSYTDDGHPVGKLVLLGPGGTRAELPPGSVGFDVAR